MVDFSKRLAKKSVAKPTLPSEIYEQLDRRSGKGPLRPAQVSVLDTWHSKFSGKQDVILKLHTGQGKTLVGLLILQSKLNEGKGPALYLCPSSPPLTTSVRVEHIVTDSPDVLEELTERDLPQTRVIHRKRLQTP